ncbi:MAG TPA: hypothetical protein VFZ77_24460 [Acidimicrobiales bacterium]
MDGTREHAERLMAPAIARRVLRGPGRRAQAPAARTAGHPARDPMVPA